MKKVKLTKKDYEKIQSHAKDLWIAKGQTDMPNVCIAYVEAFSSYLVSRNLILVDGKIYEKDS